MASAEFLRATSAEDKAKIQGSLLEGQTVILRNDKGQLEWATKLPWGLVYGVTLPADPCCQVPETIWCTPPPNLESVNGDPNTSQTRELLAQMLSLSSRLKLGLQSTQIQLTHGLSGEPQLTFSRDRMITPHDPLAA